MTGAGLEQAFLELTAPGTETDFGNVGDVGVEEAS